LYHVAEFVCSEVAHPFLVITPLRRGGVKLGPPGGKLNISVRFDGLILKNDRNFAGRFAHCFTNRNPQGFQSVHQTLGTFFKRTGVNDPKIFRIDLSPFYTWWVWISIEYLTKSIL